MKKVHMLALTLFLGTTAFVVAHQVLKQKTSQPSPEPSPESSVAPSPESQVDAIKTAVADSILTRHSQAMDECLARIDEQLEKTPSSSPDLAQPDLTQMSLDFDQLLEEGLA